MSTHAAAARTRVLLLDDDATLGRAYARMLQTRHQLDAVPVTNISAALATIASAYIAAAPFDGLVSDLQMPDCDGLEALRRIALVDARLARRAVVCTGARLTSDECMHILDLGYELVAKSEPFSLAGAIARQIARYP